MSGVTTLAPGQFAIVLLGLLLAGGYFTYQNQAVPARHEAEAESLSAIQRGFDTTFLEVLMPILRQRGGDVDSAINARFLRDWEISAQMHARHEREGLYHRTAFALVAILCFASATVIAWVWFGRKPDEKAKDATDG